MKKFLGYIRMARHLGFNIWYPKLKLVLSGYWDTANLENMATVRIPV